MPACRDTICRCFKAFSSSFLLVFLLPSLANADSDEAVRSTDDLSFLLGEWSVERVYQPGTENERSLNGELSCEKALFDQFIECLFFFERPERPPIREKVFFNFNPIYGVYESLWLSATWPIKVLMSAEPVDPSENFIWRADFLIEDGVREWVRSEWFRCEDGGFLRRTEIRTSRDPEDQWLHWMNERSTPAGINTRSQTLQECN